MDNTFLVYEDTTNTWSFSDDQGNSWTWRGEDQEVLANSSVRDWLRILFSPIYNPSGPLIFDATRQVWRWETYARVRAVPRSRELLLLLDESVILHLRTLFQRIPFNSSNADLFDFWAPAPENTLSSAASPTPIPAPAPAPHLDTSMVDDGFEDDDPFYTNKGILSPTAFSCPLPAPRILSNSHTPSKTSTNFFNQRGIGPPTMPIIDDQDTLPSPGIGPPTTPIIDDQDTLPSSVSSPDRIDTPCPTGKNPLRKVLDARRPGRKDRAQNGFEFVNVPADCFAATA